MIQKLILQNFRCHETFACDGLEQNVMIVGENGKGKTSFLEAIYILSRCRSFRTPRIRECVGWNKRGFGISGLLVEESQEAKRIKFEWSRAGRQMSLGSSENVSLKAFWGSFHAVAFVNNDRQLVTGGGSNRRQWIDSLVAAKYSEYLELSQKAMVLQRQKNALLKRGKRDRSLWRVLTTQMRPICEKIVQYRNEMTSELAPKIENHYRSLTDSKEQIEFTYTQETEKRLQKKEEDLWEMEENTRNCELGPHRDDWSLLLENKALRHFGSEGQQKSACLAMRLSEIENTLGAKERSGLILIDDVLVELDQKRSERFWGQIPQSLQTIYATVATKNHYLPERFTQKLTV